MGREMVKINAWWDIPIEKLLHCNNCNIFYQIMFFWIMSLRSIDSWIMCASFIIKELLSKVNMVLAKQFKALFSTKEKIANAVHCSETQHNYSMSQITILCTYACDIELLKLELRFQSIQFGSTAIIICKALIFVNCPSDKATHTHTHIGKKDMRQKMTRDKIARQSAL